MEVVRITPRGYCYGVVDAITLARQVARQPGIPRPIYVLGMIVHNHHVVEDLVAEGIVTLDGENRLTLLEEVTEGTVIFTAHGVSPAVKERARAKGLNCLDATCPDVTTTHNLICDKVAAGYEIIYVGKKGHPEPEGAIGHAPDHVHLVETPDDLDHLIIPPGAEVCVATQTTLSQWDTQAVIDRVLELYPAAEVHNEICLATQQRQKAAAEQSRATDVVIVVGDERSNNSNRLVQVVQQIAGRPAYLVDNVADIDPAWLRDARTVGVTAGSSTPSQITREVIHWLEAFEPDAAADRDAG